MPKSLITRRRKAGAVCEVCRSPDYKVRPNPLGNHLKPLITCNSCGNSWMCGYDGGVYAKLQGAGRKTK